MEGISRLLNDEQKTVQRQSSPVYCTLLANWQDGVSDKLPA